MVVELYPHQQKAVDEAHNGCILCGGTGVGKSRTAIAYFVSKVCGGTYGDYGTMRTPRDLVIITTAKKRDSLDWEIEASRFGITSNTATSMEGIQITVDSWNNIKEYEDDKDKFFIFDEQRVVGYGAWSKAFIKIAKSNQFIMLSATPGDTWLDYIPIFIANGWYKNKTDFINRHVVWTPRVKYPKVQRYLETGVLVRRRNQVLVQMPYVRHTRPNPVDVWCDYDKPLYEKVMKKWHVYEERPIRDVAEQFSVLRKVVNSDTSRLQAVGGLLKKHPRLIVFYNFNYELELLRDLGSSLMGHDTLSHTSSEISQSSTQPAFECQGHWTTDRGNGEVFLTCEEYSQALRTSSGSSKATSTSDSATSNDTGCAPTGTSGSSGERVAKQEETAIEEYSQLIEREKHDKGCIARLAGQTSTTDTVSSGTSTTTCRCTRGTTSGLTTEVIAVESGEATDPDFTKSAASRLQEKSSSTSSESLKTAGGSGLKTSSPSRTTGANEATTNPNQSGQTGTIREPASSSLRTVADGGEFSVAEWNGQNHDEIPATERWLYLVQYRAGAEGWNCVTTDAICFFSQTYSYRDWWQSHGRIDRLNTPYTDLYYYHLLSKTPIDKAIRAALKTKKSFNERDLKLGD